MMKKNVLFKLIALASLIWPIGSLGQTALTPCVVVETSHGERMEFLLTEEPRLEHNEAIVTLITNETTIEFQAVDILKVYLSYQENNTGLKSVTKAEGEIVLMDNSVIFSGFRPNEAVNIYTIDGKYVQCFSVNEDGCLSFPLYQMAQGCYILTINNQSIKILKK